MRYIRRRIRELGARGWKGGGVRLFVTMDELDEATEGG